MKKIFFMAMILLRSCFLFSSEIQNELVSAEALELTRIELGLVAEKIIEAKLVLEIKEQEAAFILFQLATTKSGSLSDYEIAQKEMEKAAVELKKLKNKWNELKDVLVAQELVQAVEMKAIL